MRVPHGLGMQKGRQFYDLLSQYILPVQGEIDETEPKL